MAISSSGKYYSGTSLATRTINPVIPSGVNRKLVLYVARRATVTPTALTFDGTSFLANAGTTITHSTDATFVLSSYWYDIPDVFSPSSPNVVYTISSAVTGLGLFWHVLTDAASGAPVGATAENTSGTAINNSISASNGTYVLGLIGGGDSAGVITLAGDLTEDQVQSGSGFLAKLSSLLSPSAGTKTNNATTSSGTRKLSLMLTVEPLLGPTITGSNRFGVMQDYGVSATYGVVDAYGIRPVYGIGQGGAQVSALTSTLTSSASSFVAGGAGVTLTFTARDVDSNPIEGYTPVPESGVTP